MRGARNTLVIAGIVALSALAPAGVAEAHLEPGSTGRKVKALQRNLKEISYPAGPVDGIFGYRTWSAVVAWQKVRGLPRTGKVGSRQFRMIKRDHRPRVRGHGRFVKVDLARQVLFFKHRGRVVKTIPVSTGSGKYYRAEDGTRVRARTPRGEFVVTRKIRGWRKSALGRLYYPSYFYRGYAVHGSKSVPVYPASHGCVRVPKYIAVWLFKRMPIGTRVRVAK